jgi:hypothetical protein
MMRELFTMLELPATASTTPSLNRFFATIKTERIHTREYRCQQISLTGIAGVQYYWQADGSCRVQRLLPASRRA